MPHAEPDGRVESRREGGSYVVIARRYRPQGFDELVGQAQVTQALTNAIATNRVGHAYLFTGARGIGKTSTARIFAKALNCAHGPTPQPCNVCDICQSIASGEDVDVLEIDGASNRGIDEIRQLRSNVGIRPSRSHYKIYIIDEVHMLTVPAFNALLKTLEEPPEHVKFIFCTTDVEKVPITVLSRCQRFDFPPVETSSIRDRLRFIVEGEGVQADDEALQLLARRAGGSLRDSQSLLEQLLSFCGQQITAADVHRLLGTAPSGRISAIISAIAQHEAAAALGGVDQAIAEGVDPGQLAEQLLGQFRDMMAAVAGCGAELMLSTPASDHAGLRETGQQLGLETLLAAVQILDQCLIRMRQSTHVRTLLEIALVRICSLERLDDLSELVSQFRQSGIPPASGEPRAARSAGVPAARTAPVMPETPTTESAQKKKPVEAVEADSSVHLAQPADPESPAEILTAETAERIWRQALDRVGDLTADHGGRYQRVAISAPNQLVVSFAEEYTLDKERCERPERKARLEKALQEVTGQVVRLSFEVIPESVERAVPSPAPTRWQKLKQKENHPLVRRAVELFEAEVTEVEEPPEPRSQ